MLTPVPLPDFRDSARALMHDLPRLRAAINEALLCLRVLRGEVRGWQQHPCVAMWRGAEAGLYLLREEYRAAYAEATGEVWGKDVSGPTFVGLDGERMAHIHHGGRWVPSAILPRWWGDEAVHSSHRAVLFGKWGEELIKPRPSERHRALTRSIFAAWDCPTWSEFAAQRLPGGSWPYAWPLPCLVCSGKDCDGKGYVLRVGPK